MHAETNTNSQIPKTGIFAAFLIQTRFLCVITIDFMHACIFALIAEQNSKAKDRSVMMHLRELADDDDDDKLYLNTLTLSAIKLVSTMGL